MCGVVGRLLRAAAGDTAVALSPCSFLHGILVYRGIVSCCRESPAVAVGFVQAGKLQSAIFTESLQESVCKERGLCVLFQRGRLCAPAAGGPTVHRGAAAGGGGGRPRRPTPALPAGGGGTARGGGPTGGRAAALRAAGGVTQRRRGTELRAS